MFNLLGLLTFFNHLTFCKQQKISIVMAYTYRDIQARQKQCVYNSRKETNIKIHRKQWQKKRENIFGRGIQLTGFDYFA